MQKFVLMGEDTMKLIKKILRCPNCNSTRITQIGLDPISGGDETSRVVLGRPKELLGKKWRCDVCKTLF